MTAHRTRLSPMGVFAVLAGLGLACGDPHPTEPDGAHPTFAKGSSGPTVTATSPDSAEQGTVSLDVQIVGSGFDQGSQASWDSGGVPYPKITVNSTKFVNSTKLTANITIAATATVQSYDVAVTTSTGRKGVGTELFVVTLADPRANFVWADSVLVNGAWVPAGIRGDGRLKDGSPATGTPSNEYQGLFCGVVGRLYTTGKAPSEQFYYEPGAVTSTMQTACHGGSRIYEVYLSSDASHLNPSPLALSPSSRARGLASLAPGATVTQWEGFGPIQPNCPILMFNDSFPPSQSLRYTRLPDVVAGGRSARQWRIESQGSHIGACVQNGHKAGTYVANGVTYFVPLSLTVTEVPAPAPSYP